MITTPPGPKFVKNNDQSGAKSGDHTHPTDWAQRDLALILTALLAGLRAEELRQANVGDIRGTDEGAAVIAVKGKGGKDRSVPIEAELVAVIEAYLDSRATRFPNTSTSTPATTASGMSRGTVTLVSVRDLGGSVG